MHSGQGSASKLGRAHTELSLSLHLPDFPAGPNQRCLPGCGLPTALAAVRTASTGQVLGPSCFLEVGAAAGCPPPGSGSQHPCGFSGHTMQAWCTAGCTPAQPLHVGCTQPAPPCRPGPLQGALQPSPSMQAWCIAGCTPASPSMQGALQSTPQPSPSMQVTFGYKPHMAPWLLHSSRPMAAAGAGPGGWRLAPTVVFWGVQEDGHAREGSSPRRLTEKSKSAKSLSGTAYHVVLRAPHYLIRRQTKV